jgi:methylated-DNA-[protein]-cysteine S-methyltransferase
MPQLAFATPLGFLTLVQKDDFLTGSGWEHAGEAAASGQETPLLRRAKIQILDYFAGRLRAFDLPLAPAGSPFQRFLWRALEDIPYGETRSYGAIAHLLDSAPRAVGQACRRNPLPLLIPCHRVLAAGGKLGGYSGGDGLATKRHLLRLEGASCFT